MLDALIQFENPHFLWGLLTLPIFFVLGWKYLGVFTVSITVLILALAQPLVNTVRETVSYKEHNIVGLLDFSGSMQTCYNPNLFAGADCSAQTAYESLRDNFVNFASSRPSDQFAVVLFGDESQIVTLDYGSKKAIADLARMPPMYRGTNIAAGLEEAIEVLQTKPKADRVLLIMSDGEDKISFVAKEHLAQKLKALEARIIWLRSKPLHESTRLKNDLEQLVITVGGEIRVVNNKAEVSQAFNKIDEEKLPESEKATIYESVLDLNNDPVLLSALLLCILCAYGALVFAIWLHSRT